MNTAMLHTLSLGAWCSTGELSLLAGWYMPLAQATGNTRLHPAGVCGRKRKPMGQRRNMLAINWAWLALLP